MTTTTSAPTAGSTYAAGTKTRFATVTSLWPGDLVLTADTRQAGIVTMPKTKTGGTWRAVHSVEVVAPTNGNRNRRKVVHFADAVSSHDFASSTTVIVLEAPAGDGFGTADLVAELEEAAEAPAAPIVFSDVDDALALLEAFPVTDGEVDEEFQAEAKATENGRRVAVADAPRKLWNVRLSEDERALVESLASLSGARNAGEWFRDLIVREAEAKGL